MPLRKLLKRPYGFTLVEAMVALLIFSVGLLGIAGLQVGAVRGNTSAYWHSQATWLAYDMLDRMRANTTGVTGNAYDDADTANPPGDPGCISTGCTPATLAQTDIFEWGRQLGQLPGGRGMITRVDEQITVSVMWDDARTGVTGTGCDPANPDDLFCFRVVTEL